MGDQPPDGDERIRRAQEAMESMREAEPNLRWDLIDGRVRWAISSQLKAQAEVGTERRRTAWLAALLVPVAAAAGVLWMMSDETRGPAQVRVEAPGPAPSVVPEAAAPPVAAPALDGVITLLGGNVTRDGQPLDPDAALRVGDVLVTGPGASLAVQFEDKAGFVLGADTRAELVAFDATTVEVAVEGSITVELAPRQAGQKFAVVAGERRVEVRGTVFQVTNQAGALGVVVTRGRVAVLEGTDSVDVPAGQRFELAPGAHLGRLVPRSLPDAETARLGERLRVPMVAVFRSSAEVREASALVAVAAPAGAPVTVDGMPVGVGAVRLRTTPGRHLVEVSGKSRWISAATGVDNVATVVEEEEVKQVSERPGQLDAQLRAHAPLLARCAARLAKDHTTERAELVVEVGIGADGSVGHVSAVKGLVDSDMEDCVLGLIRDRFTFPAGSKATVRQRIRL